MGPFREEAVGLVQRMRELWPDGNIVDLTRNKRREVDRIVLKLYELIGRMGHPDRTISKVMKVGFNQRRIFSMEETSRSDELLLDYAQEFWIGVQKGLSLVQPRISPEGEIDTNDPLQFLIQKGQWKVLDVRRAQNTRRIIQKCHICGSEHNLYRPNLSNLVFDHMKCIEIRGDRAEDMGLIAEYREKLLKEKLKRSLVKNPCKKCFESGLINWYPIFDPSKPGDRDFELDIDGIDFMVFSVDLNVTEIYCSDSHGKDDEDGMNFLENISDQNTEIEDECNLYNKVDARFDLETIKKYVFIDDNGQYELHNKIFNIIYGTDDEICSICPRKYKNLVDNKVIDYDEALHMVNNILYDVEQPTAVSMCDWEDEYSRVTQCPGSPNTDCDNIDNRIATYFDIYIPQVRHIKKFIENRYGAYRTVEETISEIMREEYGKAWNKSSRTSS